MEDMTKIIVMFYKGGGKHKKKRKNNLEFKVIGRISHFCFSNHEKIISKANSAKSMGIFEGILVTV